MKISDKIEANFISLFGKKSEIRIIAPGRINILGEHTDYNNGFVIPSAIDKAIFFSISKRDDLKLKIAALDLNSIHESDDINQLVTKKGDWSRMRFLFMIAL